jgi:hypothetical protein
MPMFLEGFDKNLLFGHNITDWYVCQATIVKLSSSAVML